MLRTLFHLEHVRVANATSLYVADLVWDLRPGLNVVVGGTGLGKTTLLNATLFALFGRLGLDTDRVEHLANPEYFRSRMLPGGATSKAHPLTATVRATFGRSEFEVERSLSNASLLSARRGKSKVAPEDYEQAISSALNVNDFKTHVVRLVEHLLYVSDEHYLLSWDPAIQNEILQLLFVGTKAFDEIHNLWTQALQADSLFRNARYQAHLVQKELDAVTLATEPQADDSADSIPAKRQALASMRERTDAVRDAAQERSATEREALATLQQELDALHAKFERLAETMYKASDVSLDARLRDAAVAAAPEGSPRASLARFLIAKGALTCPSCMQTPKTETQHMKHARECIAQAKCPICSLDIPKATTVKAPLGSPEDADTVSVIADEILSKAAELEAARSRTAVFDEELRRAEAAALAAARAEYEFTVAHPPEAGNQIGQKRVALEALRTRQFEYSQQLDVKLSRLKAAQEKTFSRLEGLYQRLSDQFANYAGLFLDEPCRVEFDAEGTRATRRGPGIDPPHAAFYPVINGSPRYRPEQLSEAQRLFVDLAFRMALLELWREEANATATLIVETPEGTVDMAYMIRVAQMLRTFASHGHTVIVTTNLNNDSFLPQLLATTPKNERKSRILNLLELGRPRPIQNAHKPWFNSVIRNALKQRKVQG